MGAVTAHLVWTRRHPGDRQYPRLWLDGCEIHGLHEVVIRDKVNEFVKLDLTIIVGEIIMEEPAP